MFTKTDTSGKRIWLPLFLIASLIFLSACNSKSSGSDNPIVIEGIIVSKTGNAKDRIAIDQFMAEKKSEVKKLSDKFAKILEGKMTVDQSTMRKFNAITVPSLTLNGKVLTNDHSYPEKLSNADPGAVATIFVRSGSDFVRISTSLKKSISNSTTQDDSRAVGSALSHKHPAYSVCLGGDTYEGVATLFDVVYMTEYAPIKDASGTVIGIRFVGMTISDDLVLLQRKLKT